MSFINTKIVIKLINNLQNSIRGIKDSLNEFSFKLELIWLVIVILILLYIDRDINNKIMALVLAIILLVTEMINTSIELLCNRLTRKFDYEIKKVKDVASGAVFLMILANLVYIIYLLQP